MTADTAAEHDPAEDASRNEQLAEIQYENDAAADLDDDPEGDNLGDDKLAEMSRPYLAPVEQHDEIEVHHEAAADAGWQAASEAPAADLRIGRSIFAEVARATGELDREWPPLPPPPVIVSGPDGMGADFDDAKAANEDGFIADKVETAKWERAARARVHGSAAAA